jgi:hypothetical protein
MDPKLKSSTPVWDELELKMEIPYTNILIPNQSKTRTSHSKTFRQLPCKKDSFKYSFFCNTMPDWNELPETIANSDSIKSFTSGSPLYFFKFVIVLCCVWIPN